MVIGGCDYLNEGMVFTPCTCTEDILKFHVYTAITIWLLLIEVLCILVYTGCIHRLCSIQAILTVGGHQYNI